MLNERNVSVTLLQGMVEYLLLFPFLIIIGIFVAGPFLWIWLVTIFVLFFIGLMLGTLLPNQKWLLNAGFALVIGYLTSILFSESMPSLILLALIHPIFIYRGVMYAGESWDRLLPVHFMWYGAFIVYFFSYFAFRYIDILNPYLTLISLFGVILVVMTVFISNNEHMRRLQLYRDRKTLLLVER